VPVRVVRREIALSSAVGGHPNLAALLDVFAASRRELVIVWERIQGPDVLTLLNEKGGPLEEDHAAFLLAQLLRAVSFLHSSGYAHRDIKPENALVERATGRLRLIDFGLSKHVASVATLGVGCVVRGLVVSVCLFLVSVKGMAKEGRRRGRGRARKNRKEKKRNAPPLTTLFPQQTKQKPTRK